MKILDLDRNRSTYFSPLAGGGACPPRPTTNLEIIPRDLTAPAPEPSPLLAENDRPPPRPAGESLSLARAPKKSGVSETKDNFFAAAAHILPRIFTAEASGVVTSDGFRRADLKLGVDLGKFRDLMTPYLASKDHAWWETTLDVIAANGWDIAGMVGTLISEAAGKDVSGSGFFRMRQDIRDRGLFNIRAEGFEWKDGNFGGTVNTLHGIPYSLLGSGYMRMRGYSPEFSLLTGMVANLLVHELFFERYEQPKSIYDMALMNTLGAIAGALPGCGMEVQQSLFTKQPTATFYVDDDDRRYSISFEQQKDFFEAGVPIEQRPVLPWHIELGASLKASDGLDVGLRLRLSTDENEATNVARAITGVGIGATIHYRIP